jgi:hypothetical protein
MVYNIPGKRRIEFLHRERPDISHFWLAVPQPSTNPTLTHQGKSYKNGSYDSPGSSKKNLFATLDFEIYSEESGHLLKTSSVPVNSTGNVVGFSLSSFKPRFKPYAVSINGTPPDAQQSFTAKTLIYVLPSRSYGSAVKIDNLYGGLYVQNGFNNWKGWYAIFPNGGYADGGYVSPSNISFTHLDTYASQGFNTINIPPMEVFLISHIQWQNSKSTGTIWIS